MTTILLIAITLSLLLTVLLDLRQTKRTIKLSRDHYNFYTTSFNGILGSLQEYDAAHRKECNAITASVAKITSTVETVLTGVAVELEENVEDAELDADIRLRLPIGPLGRRPVDVHRKR